MPGSTPLSADENAVSMSFDWYEYARNRGSLMLWTEDWFPDSASFRWGYYASRLRNAVALGKDQDMEWSGYIVPRSSGSLKGGLLQRILGMVAGGAKAIDYFIFGPEYTFPINCYTENGQFARMVAEMAQGHNMIAEVEDVLWTARRQTAEIALLMPRSSELWDLWNKSNTEASGQEFRCCRTSSMLAYAVDYNAEIFGLYTALAVDENIPVDIIDEDALSEPPVLNQYKVVIATEPNIPADGLRGLLAWTSNGGTLVTVSGAAAFDEYDVAVRPDPKTGFIPPSQRQRWFLHGDSTSARPAGGCTFEFRPDMNTSACEMINGSALLPVPTFPAISRETPTDSPTTYAAANFTAFAVRESSSPLMQQMEKLAIFDDGSAALAWRQLGKGSHLHFPWLPGISYAYSRAIGSGQNYSGFERGLGALLRNVSEMSSVCKPTMVSERRVEAPLLLSPDKQSAIVALLDWRCDASWCQTNSSTDQQAVSVRVRLPFSVAHIRSATHGKLAATDCSKTAGTRCEEAGVHVVCFSVSLKYGDLIELQ